MSHSWVEQPRPLPFLHDTAWRELIVLFGDLYSYFYHIIGIILLKTHTSYTSSKKHAYS